MSRASRALTSDILRVPFIQDTINLIRRSHQTYFGFSAFIDGKQKKKRKQINHLNISFFFLYLDYDKIKHDYIRNDGLFTSPSLNSTLLSVLRERLCSKTYESRPQLFVDTNENNNAFTYMLLLRSINSKIHPLPIGLRSLKSNPYLLYLLNYDEQQKQIDELSELEHYLIDMLFPHWNFLVCTEGDEFIYMILLPKTERDLLLLNTDLTILMHDLIAHYSINNIDQGIPIYDDCRYVMDGLIDEIELLVGSESPFLLPTIDQSENKANEELIGLILKI
jgi:hypothetical protein